MTRRQYRLLQLKALDLALSRKLTNEVFYKNFANPRQVGAYVGLAPSPWQSGSTNRDQGISKGAIRAPGKLDDIVVMDSLAAHKRAEVVIAIEAAGATLLYPATLLARPQSTAFAKLKRMHGEPPTG
jgi:hypothetical protein